jgi:hypothetical protein
MNTGTQISGRPAAGSWVWYGIGSEASDLPGYVVLTSQGRGGQMQPIAARQWSAGFLPSRFQGVHFRSKGDAGALPARPRGHDARAAARVIDAVKALTEAQPDWVDDPEVSARLAQYEMAFRMQTSVPELVDLRERARERARDVRGRGPRRQLRGELPAGAAPRRARACASCSSTTATGTTTAG